MKIKKFYNFICLFLILLLSMPTLQVSAQENSLPPASTYAGIVIDGSFQDWEATTRYAGGDFGLQYSTMVYDGDMLYFYFQFTENPNRVTWSGPYSNGKFAVVNNYGEQMLFQLTGDPNNRVLGVEGALFAANTTEWMGEEYTYLWEIGIPITNLPSYGVGDHNASLSFGYYQADNTEPVYIVSSVGNIASGNTESGGSEGGENVENPGGGEELPSNPPSGEVELPSNPPASGAGIVYDGNFDDWAHFPMTTIDYSTAGTSATVVDGEGALYYDGMLYGYVRTCLPAHLGEAGGEFTGSTLVMANNSEQYTFRAQYVTVDASGNINYNPQLNGLPQGSYEFYLIDSSGWKSATNIAEWEMEGNINKGTNAVYGKAIISIGPSMDQMEYYLDPAKLAAKFGMQSDELKTFSAKYERIGQTLVTCAGASTGPIIGILICLVWLYLLWVFKRCELPAWRFFLGSAGLFILQMILVRPYLTEPLGRIVAAMAGLVGKGFGIFTAYFRYGVIFIHTVQSSVTLQIDLECSGILEIMAFLSLLAFFDVYKRTEKWFVGLLGVLCIILANALRILVICLMIYVWGMDVYYVAHGVIGRILFYLLSVLLYFYVFTKPQIITTKVGKFMYGNH